MKKLRKIRSHRESLNFEEAIIESKIIEDILPPPEDLIRKEKQVRLSLILNSDTIEFFKKRAAKSGTSYQKMINSLLNQYRLHYQK